MNNKHEIAPNFELYICGRHEREKFDVEFTHILHTEDLEEPCSPPKDFQGVHKQIKFYDSEVLGAPGAPTEYDALEIVNFLNKCGLESKNGPVKLLISCLAGISRSTACGFAAICMANKGRNFNEELSFEKLRLIRPYAWPNILILRFCDKILGLEMCNHAEIVEQIERQAKSIWLP